MLNSSLERQRERRAGGEDEIDVDLNAALDTQHFVFGTQLALLRPNLVTARQEIDGPVASLAGKHRVEHVLIEIAGINLGRHKRRLCRNRARQGAGVSEGIGRCRSTGDDRRCPALGRLCRGSVGLAGGTAG